MSFWSKLIFSDRHRKKCTSSIKKEGITKNLASEAGETPLHAKDRAHEKKLARREAQRWWTCTGRVDAVCDRCTRAIEPSDGYLMWDTDSAPGGYTFATDLRHGDLLCDECFDERHLCRHAKKSHKWNCSTSPPFESTCVRCGITRTAFWQNPKYCKSD